tara:strand:- start:53 stop:907 length:855 start_codon:yes stop_codon:yes gene_type:complete
MRESNKIFSQVANDNNPASQNVRDVAKDDFEWEVPVELVPIPSEGKVYGSESGLFGITGLEIKAMTAREEDILTSRALIKKGTVVNELVKACVINKNIDVNNLLVGDRDSLMVSVRITGYGTQYNATVTCPDCGTLHKDHGFDLANLEIKRLELNPISEGINEFEYKLPVSKKTVTFKFLTIKDDMRLTRERERKQELFGADYIAGTVTETLGAHIVSVDGIRDRSKIAMFINKMPALDSAKLRGHIKKNRPGLDMSSIFQCTNCNAINRIDLPIGIHFFWPAL